MVRLARSLWREFGTDIGLDITSDLDALLYRITQGGSPAGMMIVSFGHVLAQASSQKNAIAVFVDVLSRIRLNSSLGLHYSPAPPTHRLSLLQTLSESFFIFTYMR